MTDRRDEVLRTLRSSGSEMSISEIASRIGMHPNTVRFHLRALVADGRVEQVSGARGGPGRPALMFRAHVGMDPTGPRNYQLLAGALAGLVAASPDSGVAAMAAGRAWGSRIVGDEPPRTDDEAVDRLVVLLDDLGFAPRWDPDDSGPIELRHCPFLDLVPEHEAVICPLHQGLMQGALQTLGADVTVTRLEPFVEPDLCLAHTGAAR